LHLDGDFNVFPTQGPISHPTQSRPSVISGQRIESTPTWQTCSDTALAGTGSGNQSGICRHRAQLSAVLHRDYGITLVTTLLGFVTAQICRIFSFNLKLQQG
jgi:hypothetical protein